MQEVLFIGCGEIHRNTLKKEADLKKGDPVDPFAIEEARRKLEEYYHEQGFPSPGSRCWKATSPRTAGRCS